MGNKEMTPEKKDYLKRRAKQKKLIDKKTGIKQSRAKRQGAQFVSKISEAKETITQLKAQGMPDYEAQLIFEAPGKFLVSKRKKKRQ